MAGIVRFRRYRPLLLLAVITVVVFIHFTSFKDNSAAFSVDRLKSHTGWDSSSETELGQKPVGEQKPKPPPVVPIPPIEEPSPKPRPQQATTKSKALEPSKSPVNAPVNASVSSKSTTKKAPTPTVPSEHHDHSTETAKAAPTEDRWIKSTEHFPVPSESIIPLPTPQSEKIPQIQASFATESETKRKVRLDRLEAVKDAFKHSWSGYKKYAWGHDEVMPVSKYFNDPFGGWGATLVDSLDTLWIMGMEKEFMEAVEEVAKIDFAATPMASIPVFETVIRYLGGLIAAYDVSGAKHKILLTKAIELGDMIYGAFDTPNRMPVLHWGFRPRQTALKVRAAVASVSAELGSLTVEFTRLAQITGNNTYYDAVQRITNALEESQNESNLPGMWPMIIDASGCKVVRPNPQLKGVVSAVPPPKDGIYATDKPKDKKTSEIAIVGKEKEKRAEKDTKTPTANTPEPSATCLPQGLTKPSYQREEKFTLGGMADSLYEYLIKEYILLGGKSQYKKMYEAVVEVAKEHLFYRPYTAGNPDILLTGNVYVSPGAKPRFDGDTGHLSCFVGGMLALGARALNRDDDLKFAAKITDGCVWAYDAFPSGIMPEWFRVAPCNKTTECQFDTELYHDMLVPDYQRPTKLPTVEPHQHPKRAPVEAPKTVAEAAHNIITAEGLPSGFTMIGDRRYILRPEAIESVFIMYRVSADSKWQDKGWRMFQSIVNATQTEAAFSAIADVTKVPGDPQFFHLDSQESFFNAETLKYFYLLFSDPDLISLDEYVLNTEAHPLAQPKKKSS
ncbi:seven-hairpin glycosidase [Choiromyces venosus 120613-1]|uniref:alpha-1,2-Mannosidase n=1 Tax=Choiromyces venosus 120613-1 TaxID=1336337 RepID=A0A3N4JKV6_9PEZI|nr:seven-hairpin glycosidase [Choiromyces venosus 120613-1]